MDGGLLPSRHLATSSFVQKSYRQQSTGQLLILAIERGFSLCQGKEACSDHLINSVNYPNHSFSFMPQLLIPSLDFCLAFPSDVFRSLLHLQIRLWVEPHLCLLVQSRHKASEDYTVGSYMASKTTESCFHPFVQTGSLSSHVGKKLKTVKQWKNLMMERKKIEGTLYLRKVLAVIVEALCFGGYPCRQDLTSSLQTQTSFLALFFCIFPFSLLTTREGYN